MSGLTDDVRLAFRVFRHGPVFAAGVILTLGSGIAACTVILALVNAVLYGRYEVYREPHRLVAIWEQNARLGVVGAASVRNAADWGAGARSLQRVGTFEPSSFTLSGDGEPEALQGGSVSPDLLRLLDAKPALGRLFAAADSSSGPARQVLLSYGLWQRRYSGRPDIVGRALSVNGSPATILGVLADGFALAPFAGVEPDLVVAAGNPWLAARSSRTAVVVGRLRPGATTAQARAELSGVASRLERLDPENRGWGVLVLNPMEFDFQGDGQFLVVLAVAVLFVMMIVCANVTNLLLSRGASRTREFATRLALGAGRLRLARQLLAEAAVLGLSGGLLGVCLAYAACGGLSWWISGSALGHLRIVLDTRVLSAAAVLSMGSALLVGAVPSFRLSRTPLMTGLRACAGVGAPPRRLHTLLVVGEIALSSVLLVGAGLVLQGVANLREVDPGFQPAGLATQRIVLPDARYPVATARAAFAEQLLARLAADPRLLGVALASHVPAVGGEAPVAGFTPERPNRPGAGRPPSASVISASAGYFQTMGVELKAGRSFTAGDTPGTLPVAIVSEGLARRWLDERRAVGTRLLLDGEWRTIVGIAADVRNFHLNVAPAPAIYVPYSQRAVPRMVLVLRARGNDPLAWAGAVRHELHAMDAEIPVRQPRLIRDAIEESLGGFDMTRLLIGALAAAALVLAAVGIYGVVAYSVARRTREIGLRLALGAAPRRLQREVIREGLRLAVVGGLPGLALAAAVGRLLAAKLHGVKAADPLVFAAVTGLIVATVVIASLAPARRASRVEPTVALRSE